MVEKSVPDAFAATGLERWLHNRAIRPRVIAGVKTNNSIEATARSGGCLAALYRHSFARHVSKFSYQKLTRAAVRDAFPLNSLVI